MTLGARSRLLAQCGFDVDADDSGGAVVLHQRHGDPTGAAADVEDRGAMQIQSLDDAPDLVGAAGRQVPLTPQPFEEGDITFSVVICVIGLHRFIPAGDANVQRVEPHRRRSSIQPVVDTGAANVRIRFHQRGDRDYDVTATSDDGSTATSTFVIPLSPTEMEQAVIARTRSTRMVTAVDPNPVSAEQVGTKLADALLRDDVATLYERVRDGSTQVRLTLQLGDEPELLGIPWEFLCRDGVFLAGQVRTPIVRELETTAKAHERVVEGRLQMLGVVASPIGLAELDVNGEITRVEAALSSMRDRIDIVWMGVSRDGGGWTRQPCTFTMLRKALADTTFHIVHFIGHGAFVDGQSSLFLTDQNGRPDQVPATKLAQIVGQQTALQLVVLNSCEGARTTAKDPFAGVATKLVQQGCGAVVAMQFEITDEAAKTFAEEFYTALIDQQLPVDAAMARARLAMMDFNNNEFATPVLFLRRGDPQLFEFRGAVARSIGVMRRRWRRIAAIAAPAGAALIGFLAVIGAFGGGSDNTAHPATADASIAAAAATPAAATTLPVTTPATTAPPATLPPSTTAVPQNGDARAFRSDRLRGTFNVAVVQFTAVPDTNQFAYDEATDAANDLVRYLNTEFTTAAGAPADQQIDVGLYAPPSANSTEADLQQFAQDMNADVVVTATLRADDRGSSFEPSFTLRNPASSTQLDLAGAFELGAARTSPNGFDDQVVRRVVRSTLRSRACVLTYLVEGLSDYRNALYPDAQRQFELAADPATCAAANASASVADSGQDVAQLFLGTIAIIDGRLDQADAAFDRALALSNEPRLIARARFGKAEVAFQRIHADACRPSGSTPVADTELRDVIGQLASALQDYTQTATTGQPVSGYVEAQAHLRLGRARLCRGLVEIAARTDARRDLDAVRTAYENDTPTVLRPLAAEAYAGLAYLDLVIDSDPTAALADADRAIELATAPDRASTFLRLRALLDHQLGNLDSVTNDCAQVTEQPCPFGTTNQFLGVFTEPIAQAVPQTGSYSAIELALAAWFIAVGLGLLRVARARPPGGATPLR